MDANQNSTNANQATNHDSILALPPYTQGRTTAAIVRSLLIPGVDIVIYEQLENVPVPSM